MRKVLLALFLITSALAFGQEKVKKIKVNLSSPQKAVATHLFYLQEDNYTPELAIKAFHWEGVNKSYTEKQKIRIAIHLKQIYDGMGVFIDTSKISTNPFYTDSIGDNIRHRYTVYPELGKIYVEKIGDKWLYSAASIENVEPIFKEVFPYGLHNLVKITASFSHQKKYFGLYMYQLVGIFLILVFAFILHKLLTIFFQFFISKVVVKVVHARLALEYIKPVTKPLSLFMVFWVVSLLVPVLLLSPEVGPWVIKTLRATLPFFGMMVFYRLVDVLVDYLQKLALRTESSLDDQLVPLLRKALKTFVVVVGVLFILANFDFDVTALVAGLGIGGFALALASQDMLKNFFGSIMIFMDRPFQVGDWVVADNIDGDIEEVGFRSTRIRTFHNSLIYVPNGKLADMTIDNYGERKYRRYKTFLAVTYDTPPESIDVFVEGLKMIVQRHPKTRKDYYNIYFNEFGASSLNILFYIFFEVPSWPEELRARHEINLEIINLAKRLGIRFAFPTQTLHVEEFPEKKSLTPSDYMDKDGLNNELKAHFEE